MSQYRSAQDEEYDVRKYKKRAQNHVSLDYGYGVQA